MGNDCFANFQLASVTDSYRPRADYRECCSIFPLPDIDFDEQEGHVYYSTVYSTIHDVIEPALRGAAMALYFCAMYILGTSLEPVGTGFLSDYFTNGAALAAG